MADHRVTDLSYGHLGDVSYDIDEGQWGFSVDNSQNQIFEQVTPFKQSIASSVQNVPSTTKTPLNLARSQMKWIVKYRPEIFPANAITSTFVRASSTSHLKHPPSYSRLLAIGGAVDAGNQPGHRTDPIIAIPCGEAGHVLRLIRPQVEYRGWHKQSAAKLPLLNVASGDVAYWVGTGGTIHQITFANEQSVSSNLLAVRQASLITILWPMYHDQPIRAMMPSGYDKQYPPSRLSANPVAVLTAEKCGSRKHADVSFNPFYTRQFGLVDDAGHWSIWDVEGRMRKSSNLELVPGKSGDIYDGFVPNSHKKNSDTADGWHRVLWATNVSTIVVCNRFHIAVFDVNTTPTRLPTPGALSTKADDWILDIRRSPAESSHLFVLTTSRIFWIEVIAAREERDGHDAGIRIILSYRHFRDVSDGTLSLTVLKGDDVSVLISSSNDSLVNFYTFSMTLGPAGAPSSSQGSFTLSTSLDGDLHHEMLQTVCFLPTPIISNSSRTPGPELQLIERNVKFYQIWALTSTLALRSALYAMQVIPAGSSSSLRLHISAPATRLALRRRLPDSGKAVSNSFVVPDELTSEEEIDDIPNLSQNYQQSRRNNIGMGSLKPRLNWRRIFQQVFMDNYTVHPPNASLIRSFETMSELLDVASHNMRQNMEEDGLPMTSLLELAHFSDFSGDLQQSAPILNSFVELLRMNQDPDNSPGFILSDLTSCPGIGLSVIDGSGLSDLLKVYDQVGEVWMASLPLKVSNLARLSKFKLARKVAVELCLSSIGISRRKGPSHVAVAHSTGGEMDLTRYNEGSNDSGLLISPQITTNLLPEAGSSLLTPSRTPSVYSQASTNTTESLESPSISRLRQYAVSIKSQPDPSESALLAQWPSSPGADPTLYSWRSMADQELDENDPRRRREEARRRRRTEKFLQRERMKESQVSSQPTPIRSGSQPELAQSATSSQVVDDIPMTQPDRGVFGARSAKPGKKKAGRRRAAGF